MQPAAHHMATASLWLLPMRVRANRGMCGRCFLKPVALDEAPSGSLLFCGLLYRPRSDCQEEAHRDLADGGRLRRRGPPCRAHVLALGNARDGCILCWLDVTLPRRSERPPTAKGLSIGWASGQGGPRRHVATLSSSAHRHDRAHHAADIPGSLKSSGGCSEVGPGCVFVVAGVGFQAAVQDADEPVGQLS